MTEPVGDASQHSKEATRQSVWDQLLGDGVSLSPHGRIPTFDGQNRAAERLRRWPLYRQARAVMVPPDETLLQVRINSLRDGKRLLMATPGLRDGFYELVAADLPPRQWHRAVTASGVKALGRRLVTSLDALGAVDLLVTGAVAVDASGRRVGKGTGYFDLEFAILRHVGSIGEDTPVMGLVHERQILPQVPVTLGDVPVDWIVTPDRLFSCLGRGPKPEGILWDRVPLRRVRQMRPLWEIRRVLGRQAGDRNV